MSDREILNFTLKLPFIGEINGEWEPSEVEKEASWEMYILLITHASFLKTKSEDVLIRESVFVFRSFFISLHVILVKYGLSIHQPKDKNPISLGYIAVLILNHAFRSFVEKWRYLIKHEKKNKNSVKNLESDIYRIARDLNILEENLEDLIHYNIPGIVRDLNILEENLGDLIHRNIPEITKDLNSIRETLKDFTNLLARAVNIPSVIVTNLLD